MYRKSIKSLNFLKYCQNTDFVIEVMMSLKPTKSYKDEIILNEGDSIKELLILKNGILSMEKLIKFFLPALKNLEKFFIPPHEILKFKILNLRKNEYFGDSLMIQNQKSPISLRVKSKYAELFLMEKIELLKLSNKYPEIYNKIFSISDFNIKQILSILKNAEKLVHSLEKDKKYIGKKSINIVNLADYHLRKNKDSTKTLENYKENKIFNEEEIHSNNDSLNEINFVEKDKYKSDIMSKSLLNPN